VVVPHLLFKWFSPGNYSDYYFTPATDTFALICAGTHANGNPAISPGQLRWLQSSVWSNNVCQFILDVDGAVPGYQLRSVFDRTIGYHTWDTRMVALTVKPAAFSVVANLNHYADFSAQDYPGSPRGPAPLKNTTAGRWVLAWARVNNPSYSISEITVGGQTCVLSSEVTVGAAGRWRCGLVKLTSGGDKDVYFTGTFAAVNIGVGAMELHDPFNDTDLSFGGSGAADANAVTITTIGANSFLIASMVGNMNGETRVTTPGWVDAPDFTNSATYERGAILFDSGAIGNKTVQYAMGADRVVAFEIGGALLDVRYGRPSSDELQGDWGASSGGVLYPMVNEEVAEDTNHIYVFGQSTCEMGLSGVIDPLTSTFHTLKLRAKSDAGSASLRVTLLQGITQIAQWTQAITGTWVVYEFNLSGAQTDSITDYTTLKVRLETL
jgi:hypothetical protein